MGAILCISLNDSLFDFFSLHYLNELHKIYGNQTPFVSTVLLICWHCLNKHFRASSFPCFCFTDLVVGFPAKGRRKERRGLQKGQTGREQALVQSAGYSGLCFVFGLFEGREELENNSLFLCTHTLAHPHAFQTENIRVGQAQSHIDQTIHFSDAETKTRRSKVAC